MEKRNVESARRSRVLGLFALLVAAIGVIVAGTVALAAPGDTNVDLPWSILLDYDEEEHVVVEASELYELSGLRRTDDWGLDAGKIDGERGVVVHDAGSYEVTVTPKPGCTVNGGSSPRTIPITVNRSGGRPILDSPVRLAENQWNKEREGVYMNEGPCILYAGVPRTFSVRVLKTAESYEGDAFTLEEGDASVQFGENAGGFTILDEHCADGVYYFTIVASNPMDTQFGIGSNERTNLRFGWARSVRIVGASANQGADPDAGPVQGTATFTFEKEAQATGPFEFEAAFKTFDDEPYEGFLSYELEKRDGSSKSALVSPEPFDATGTDDPNAISLDATKGVVTFKLEPGDKLKLSGFPTETVLGTGELAATKYEVREKAASSYRVSWTRNGYPLRDLEDGAVRETFAKANSWDASIGSRSVALKATNTSSSVSYTPKVRKAIVATDGTELTSWDFSTSSFTLELKRDSDGVAVERATDATGLAEWERVELKVGESVSYTVTEKAPDTGARVKDLTYDTTPHRLLVRVSGSGAIETYWDGARVAGDAVPTLKNTYAPVVPATPELGLTKVLDTTGASTSTTPPVLEENGFSFVLEAKDGAPLPESAEGSTRVTATNDNDGRVAFGEITYDRVGTYEYTVREVPSAGMGAGIVSDSTVHEIVVSVTQGTDGTPQSSWTWDGEPVSTIADATITNYVRTGDLAVKLEVAAPFDTLDSGASFPVTVRLGDSSITGTFGDWDFKAGVATKAMKHGQTFTAKGLPANTTYTVSERSSSTYAASYSGGTGGAPNTGNVAAAGSSTITVTNTRKISERTLSITKQLTDGFVAAGQTFPVTVSLSMDGTTWSLTGFSDGTFTNGVATRSLKDGETWNLSGIPVGVRYKVEESPGTDLKELYTTTYSSPTLPNATPINPIRGQVAGVSDVSVTIANTRKMDGRLTVTKEVGNLSEFPAIAGVERRFPLTLTLLSPDGATPVSGHVGDLTFDAQGRYTFELEHGESIAFEGLPVGARYTLAEADEPSYDTSYEVDGTTATSGSTAEGVISSSGSTVMVKNSFKPADLTVEKKIAEGGNRLHTFQFQIILDDSYCTGDLDVTLGADTTAGGLTSDGKLAFTNGYSSVFSLTGTTDTDTTSLTVKNLPQGVDFEVVELPSSAPDYTATYAVSGAATNVDVSGGSAKGRLGVSSAAGTPTQNTVTITNTYAGGTLVVFNTVVDSDPASVDAFTYAVTVDDPSVNGPRGDVNFTNGTATFTLAHEDTKEIPGLPAGATATVTQAEKTGYSVTPGAEITRTIAKGGTVRADFTNTRRTDGTLTIAKQVVDPAPWQVGRTYVFEVTLNDASFSNTVNDIAFSGGAATVDLTPDAATGSASIELTDLPEVGYRVRELGYRSGSGIESSADYTTTATLNGSAVAGLTDRTVRGTLTSTDTTDSVTFTNTYATGSLTITNTVADAGTQQDQARAFTYDITIGDATHEFPGERTYGGLTFEGGHATVALSNRASSVTIPDLPAGTPYTVRQTGIVDGTPLDQYETTIAGSETGTISGAVTVAYVNTCKVGDLTVVKTIGAGANQMRAFQITLVKDLNPESLNGTTGTITADGAENYVTTNDYDPAGAGGSSLVAEGEMDGSGNIVITFTNTREGYTPPDPGGGDGGGGGNSPKPDEPAGDELVVIHRLYNVKSGEHLFTTDENEVRVLGSSDVYPWQYEGYAWYEPASSSKPVYRLYNPNTGEHLYTYDTNEVEVLSSRSIGWRYEGIAWYSDEAETVPIYRLFNKHLKSAGAHHFTTDANEYDVLAQRQWNQEDVAFYAAEKGVPYWHGEPPMPDWLAELLKPRF